MYRPQLTASHQCQVHLDWSSWELWNITNSRNLGVPSPESIHCSTSSLVSPRTNIWARTNISLYMVAQETEKINFEKWSSATTSTSLEEEFIHYLLKIQTEAPHLQLIQPDSVLMTSSQPKELLAKDDSVSSQLTRVWRRILFRQLVVK